MTIALPLLSASCLRLVLPSPSQEQPTTRALRTPAAEGLHTLVLQLVHPVLQLVHPVLHIVHPALHIVRPVLQIVHPVLQIVHLATRP